MLRRKKHLIILISLALITSLILFSMSDVYKNRITYRNKLIRFHVLANSDAPFDQALKLKVRDKVMGEIHDRFNPKNIEEARGILKDNLEEVEKIAREEIQENGFNYPVNVFLEDHEFPTKNYGSITLPAGTYQALRVVIGNGEGKNWWCVLFPPLCLIDIKNGLTNQKAQEELKEVLTQEEYEMINSAAQEGEIPIKLKFKIVEILEKSKWKINKLVGFKN